MLLIFLLTIIALIIEKYHMVVAAMIGASLTIFFGSFIYKIFTPEEAFTQFIDGSTLRLVLGILLLMEGLAKSGLFQFIGLWVVRLVGNRPKILFSAFMFLTAILTTSIPNLPAMLIIGAITASIAKSLRLKLRTWIMYEAIACNAGSIGLMISSIPNLILASEFGFTFSQFIRITLPLSLLVVYVTTLIGLKVADLIEEGEQEVDISSLDPWQAVRDKGILIRSTAIFLATIALFFLHEKTGIPLDVVALGGAVIMLWIGVTEPEELFRSINWGVFFFLGAFYIIIGSMEKTGALDVLAKAVAPIYAMQPLISLSATLWISGITSGLIDNIPVTLTLLPVIKKAAEASQAPITRLAWATGIGANLGGSLTYFASPPSVVAISILEKEDPTFSPSDFMKLGVPITIVQLVVANIYLFLWPLF